MMIYSIIKLLMQTFSLHRVKSSKVRVTAVILRFALNSYYLLRETKGIDEFLNCRLKPAGLWPCDKGPRLRIGPVSNGHDPASFKRQFKNESLLFYFQSFLFYIYIFLKA